MKQEDIDKLLGKKDKPQLVMTLEGISVPVLSTGTYLVVCDDRKDVRSNHPEFGHFQVVNKEDEGAISIFVKKV